MSNTNAKIPDFIKDGAIRAIRAGGVSLAQDIARGLTVQEIETLIMGLGIILAEKKAIPQ